MGETTKTTAQNGTFGKGLAKLIICSAIGIVVFFVQFNGKPVFNYLYQDFFQKMIIRGAEPIIVSLIPPMMLIGHIWGKRFAKKGSFLHRFFEKETWFHVVMYVISIIFCAIYYLKLDNPLLPLLENGNVGGTMFDIILPIVVACNPMATFILPLLASFGLLQVIGVLLEPLMRRGWKTPGKSALDMVTSIVGAAVVGIVLTTDLFKKKEYTNREAFFIATCFSLNSVGSCTTNMSLAGVVHQFGFLFITYFTLAFVVGAIMVRLRPIRKYPDVYVDGTLQTEAMRTENLHYGRDTLKRAIEAGVNQANIAGNPVKEMLKGFLSGCRVVLILVPTMITIGCIGLMICEFTPVVRWISMPLVPVLNLLQIEDAAMAAQAILTGGIDVALPSIIISSVSSEATRFFVCGVSLLQVLYISETMLPVYTLGIPCKFRDVLIVFVERTLISIPLMALATHIVYGIFL